ncbi:MAG: PIN domain-containing protein [Actinomycetota bacterium]|nr:PIN domain-containing protein [Actinomycetota bacterium]
MRNKVYADTNLFIRFFTGEPADQAEESRKFLNKVSDEEYELFICDLVIAEIIYVLESVYNLEKTEVVEKIFAIAEINNTVIENRRVVLKALDFYEEKNIDFIDAYIAGHMAKNNCSKIFSFDSDFKRIDFIKKIIN